MTARTAINADIVIISVTATETATNAVFQNGNRNLKSYFVKTCPMFERG